MKKEYVKLNKISYSNLSIECYRLSVVIICALETHAP